MHLFVTVNVKVAYPYSVGTCINVPVITMLYVPADVIVDQSNVFVESVNVIPEIDGD